MRAGCCIWLLYGLAVRPSSVSLDHPQPTCRQRCLKRAQVPLANIKNVRLAADANSDCGGGMARRPVEDAVSSAHVAGGDHHASSRLGHDRKDSRHLLIRSLTSGHALNARTKFAKLVLDSFEPLREFGQVVSFPLKWLVTIAHVSRPALLGHY
jgi:hypothetical protein